MVSLLVVAALVRADLRPAMDRPNVILVFLDDAGYGDFEHNGNPVIETPTIARMAREGANFTQFYAASAACTASRYSLLTGRYPKRSGFPSWVLDPGSPQHLTSSETTLAEVLKAKCYATAIFGKWHLGTPNERNGQTPDALPLAHGFDRWIGTDVSHDYDASRLMESHAAGYRTIANGLTKQPDVCASLTERYADAAIDFARQNREKPFFVYLAPNMPHLGLFVGKAFAGRSRRGMLGDVMAELDHHLGRLWKTVEEMGLAKNTLVLVTSDNGPWIRYQNTASDPKYGEARMHVGYAQPFRDGKGSSWEGGHRVPGVIYWPGTIRPGQRLDPMSTLDVLPTLAALAGAKVGHPVDGRDLCSTVLTGKSPADSFEFVYSGSDNQGWAIRQGPWKLHIRITSQTGDSYGFAASRETPLLFQVEQDLGERFDRSSEQPAIRDRLLKRLAEWEQGEGNVREACVRNKT